MPATVRRKPFSLEKHLANRLQSPALVFDWDCDWKDDAEDQEIGMSGRIFGAP
jgi:hypothetical protein